MHLFRIYDDVIRVVPFQKSWVYCSKLMQGSLKEALTLYVRKVSRSTPVALIDVTEGLWSSRDL